MAEHIKEESEKPERTYTFLDGTTITEEQFREAQRKGLEDANREFGGFM